MSKRQEKKTKTFQRRVDLLRAEYRYVVSKIVAEYSCYVEELYPTPFDCSPAEWVPKKDRHTESVKNIDDIFMELKQVNFNQE